ncbi:MAG: WD40 repeat domain-containing protein [Nanoarchaeota archaeon]|nr:WD40 repeat domain-containing protein [Nanoarchaeota archaeon]
MKIWADSNMNMKKIILLLILICLSSFVFAEDKFSTDTIPPLTAEEKKDAPELYSGNVHPPWGVLCMNFTYNVMYKDKGGRAPEYVRINLNGEWHDMIKTKGDYKTGVTYTYNIVPDSGKQLFYYYEASNGKSRARTSLIDTPDLGPLLFSEKLDNNQIILLDKQGNEIWNYPTGIDWVEGVAVSKDGNYIAAVTHFYIYLFSKESKEPLWKFCKTCELPPFIVSTIAAGVAISAEGDYIAATLDGTLYFFNKESNKPLWARDIESAAIGVDMSDDANVIAMGTGNAEGGKGQQILLFDKEGNKLGEYKPEHPGYDQTGDFYQPDVTSDGKYVAISTGCPDRRAYLFSGEGNLLFRSEELAKDSPVHKSAISDDGNLIAYSLDHSQGKEILFLFDNNGNKLWDFSSQSDSTARAVSISGDGNYVAIGTTTGHVYLFSKNDNNPLWKFSEFGYFVFFGDVKLNQDGTLLAAGGTTKKVYLFSKNSNKPLWEYQTNTWINKIDFNGEYIVAGTGPREFFGEGKSLTDDKVSCKEIIQPAQIKETSGMCGDGRCISPTETTENCPQDCSLDYEGDIGTVCGDGICVSPQENTDTCCEDCGGCKGDKAVKIEKEAICGNNFCEDWIETKENCPQDCKDDDFDGLEKDENIGEEEKSTLRIIIDFFKRLFGK